MATHIPNSSTSVQNGPNSPKLNRCEHVGLDNRKHGRSRANLDRTRPHICRHRPIVRTRRSAIVRRSNSPATLVFAYLLKLAPQLPGHIARTTFELLGHLCSLHRMRGAGQTWLQKEVRAHARALLELASPQFLGPFRAKIWRRRVRTRPTSPQGWPTPRSRIAQGVDQAVSCAKTIRGRHRPPSSANCVCVCGWHLARPGPVWTTSGWLRPNSGQHGSTGP